MTDPITRATWLFEQGYSCSQSLLTAFADQLDVSEDIALKIASPFGGGIARQGETCGAVTGALMVLGLKFGSSTTNNKEAVYHISQEFINRFAAVNGTIKCKELIKFDLSQPEELLEARTQKVFSTICPGFVRSSAEIIHSMLTST